VIKISGMTMLWKHQPVIASKEAQSEMPDDVVVITANCMKYILPQLEENALIIIAAIRCALI